MSKSVEYIINLKDLASRVLSAIGKKTDEVDSKFNKLNRSANNTSISLGSMVKGFIGLQVVQKGFEIFKNDIIGAGAALEQTAISFEVMTGSAETAKKLMTDLQRMGTLTPFETKDLNENAKLLMNFGIETKKILPTLHMLGDVSGGNKEKLDRLSLAYGQITATGRLMGQDLNQMINSGFNPLQIISQKTGRSMKDLKKDMENGSISADMVTQAFIDVTSEGGRFFGMMDKQSKTTAGLWSTLVDNISIIGMEMGTAILPTINKIMEKVTFAIDWIKVNFGKIKEVFAPITEAIRPILDAFDYMLTSMGLVGEQGGVMSKIFNAIGAILQALSPLLKYVGTMTGILIRVVADLVGWIINAFVWIGKLFGYKDKKFSNPNAVDNTAFAKEIEDQKKTLLDKTGGGLSTGNYGALSGSTNTKKAAETSRATTINITINKLVENLNLHSQTVKQGASMIKDEITKSLISSVNDAVILSGR